MHFLPGECAESCERAFLARVPLPASFFGLDRACERFFTWSDESLPWAPPQLLVRKYFGASRNLVSAEELSCELTSFLTEVAGLTFLS